MSVSEQEFDGIEQDNTVADRNALRKRFLRPIDTSITLKHLMWQELKLSKLLGGWIPAVSIYEQKLHLGRHTYLHNRNVKFLYERIMELPKKLNEHDWIPEHINEAYERIFAAESVKAFYLSYLFVQKKINIAYDNLITQVDPVLNAPTLDQLKLIFVERSSMLEWVALQAQFAELESELEAQKLVEWECYLAQVWHIFETNGENSGNETDIFMWPPHLVKHPMGPLPEKALLESRFPKYENKKPQKSYEDTEMSVLHDSVKQMIYIYATEIFAGETLSSIYYYVDHMPMTFYFDCARHMWDEFRHSEMGMRRLLQMGYSVDQFKWLGGPMKKDVKENFTELYSTLTMLGEACGFKKKRKSAEAFWKFNDALSAITVEYDLSDERRHIDFATKWGPELYKKIDMIVTFQEMAEKARTRRLTELESVLPEEIEKLAKNFPIFCGFHTSELAYDKY
jgi:hypothetical protein